MVTQPTAPLAGLNAMLREEPGVLAALGRASTVLVVPEPARAVTLAGLLAASRRAPMVVAVPTAADAERLSADLQNFLPANAVELFPAWETLPFERVSPSIETMGLRLRTMWRLRTADPSLSVIVAPARALVQRLGPHVEDVEPIRVALRDQVDSLQLIEQLVLSGYRREYQVEHRGEIAVRGSIIDVFPATADVPVRIDLWGDEVERLTEFSVADQRSTIDLEELSVFPARELLPSEEVCERAEQLLASQPWGREQWQRLADGEVFEGMEAWMAWLADSEHVLFDLVPDDGLILLADPRRLRDRAADIAADSGTQNVHQRVSTQVGIKGEYGFQILIQYADGKSQLFDNYSELYDSLRAGNSSTLWNGTIPAHIATSDAAVVERAVPFSDSFLASFQTLPTTAVFRRSSEIFLFENGGLQDASVRFVDLTPQSDFVDDVYAPGRKMSLPMPTEIVVTPTILSAPVRALPVIETTYPSITGDVEIRNVTENAVEVIVIRVGFDDRNQDGQPDSTELPDRGEVQVVMLKSAEMQEILRRASKLPSVRTNLLNGELELETKDTKGVMIPSASDIDRWVEDYRNNPSKPAGAYAIITLDPSMGVRVLKVFSVRDFDSKNEELPIVTKEDGVAEEEDRSKNTGIEEQGKP